MTFLWTKQWACDKLPVTPSTHPREPVLSEWSEERPGIGIDKSYNSDHSHMHAWGISARVITKTKHWHGEITYSM